MLKIKFWSIFFSLLAISFAGKSQSKGPVIDEIVAKVDNYIILRSELEDTYRDYLQQFEMTERDAKCKALQDLVMNKVLVAKAEIDSIVVADEEVQGELDRRMQYMTSQFGSLERIEEYFDKPIDQFREELRDPLREQLLAQRMRSEITADIKVTPAEVKRFFNRIPADSLPYFSKEVTVGQIVRIPTIGQSQKSKARQRALEIRNQIVRGEEITSRYQNIQIALNEDNTLLVKTPQGETTGEWQIRNTFITFNIETANAAVDRLNGEWLALIEDGNLKLIHSDIDNQSSFTLTGADGGASHLSKSQLSQQWSIAAAYESGASFAEMARDHSDDPGSAANGGALGFQTRGALVPEYEATAMNLKPGQISMPVESQFGYHIIQLIERRGNEYNSRHILVKFNSSELDIEASAEFLDSLRTMILRDSISFEKAAKEHSEDKLTASAGGFLLDQATGSNKVSVQDLDPTLYFAIDTMQVGTVSQPMSFRMDDGTNAVRIIYYKSSTPPHEASLEKDYPKIQAAALNQKRQKVLFDWFEEAQKEVFIETDEKYDHCNITKNYSALTNTSNP